MEKAHAGKRGERGASQTIPGGRGKGFAKVTIENTFPKKKIQTEYTQFLLTIPNTGTHFLFNLNGELFRQKEDIVWEGGKRKGP